MAELTDQAVGDTLDYLGRTQPLASQRLTTLPSASAGGGGAVAPPITVPSGPGGTAPGGAPVPMGSDASAFAQALRAAGLGQDALKVARGTGSPGTAPVGAPSDQVSGGELALGSSVPGRLTSQADIQALLNDPAALKAAFPDLSPAEAQSLLESMGGGEGAGLALGELAGKVIPFVGAGIDIGMSAAGGKVPPAQQGVNAAIDVAGAALVPLTAGGSEVAVPFAKTHAGAAFDLFGDNQRGTTRNVLDMFNPAVGFLDTVGGILGIDFFGGQGSYAPKRQAAGAEAGADLSKLSGAYQAAATSGDPSAVLAALSGAQGDRGAVRSYLQLPADLAEQLGIQPGPGISPVGGGMQVDWGYISPQQFSQLMRAFQAQPDLIGQTVRGSGDVGYLPQDQAQQVAAAAAGDAQALLSYLVTQGGGPSGGTEGPGAPAPVVPGGPAGALGFAQEVTA